LQYLSFCVSLIMFGEFLQILYVIVTFAHFSETLLTLSYVHFKVRKHLALSKQEKTLQSIVSTIRFPLLS